MMVNNQIFFSVIIKIKKENLLKINQLFSYKVKIIKQVHDFFYLRLLEKDLELLKKSHIEYQIISYQGIKHFYFLLIRHLSVFVGIILFLLIIYANTLTIKEISFSTHTKDNDRIEDIISRHMYSVYGLNFMRSDINDINLILRKEFSHFEWVSVKRDGCVLNVKILEPSIINKQIEHIEGYGDLIANKDGLIKFFQVTHGIPLIEQNQYVKKGQVLVTGNLRYRNQDESEFYIPASGEVYAEVWYTKTIVVPKKTSVTEYTGNISLEKRFSLFGLDFTYKPSKIKYDNYDKDISYEYLKIFSYKIPIGVKKIHYLEKDDIINVYDESTALDYAVSTIRYQMSQQFKEEDKILSIECINQNEDEDNYYYKIFVRTYENIAIFQRRALNE